MAFCNQCGAKMVEGAKFCFECGTRAVDVPGQTKDKQENGYRICPGCGATVGSFSTHCPMCGNEMGNAEFTFIGKEDTKGKSKKTNDE